MIIYKIRKCCSYSNEISFYNENYNSLDEAKSVFSYLYNNFNINNDLLEIVEFELVEKRIIK